MLIALLCAPGMLKRLPSNETQLLGSMCSPAADLFRRWPDRDGSVLAVRAPEQCL